jgi:hypothetical protein
VVDVAVTLPGNGNWQILDSKCDSAYVKTNVKKQSHNDGQVSYLVSACLLPETPVGIWYTDVWLTTNNPSSQRLRVPLTVEIEPALSVSPNVVELGPVRVGDEVERKILIRGTREFRITAIEPADGQLSLRGNTPDPKPVHVVTIRFKPDQAGELHRTMRISTDLNEDTEVVVRASARALK